MIINWSKFQCQKFQEKKQLIIKRNFCYPNLFQSSFLKNDVTNISQERNDFVTNKIKNSTFGFFHPNSIIKKNIVYKGGAQWMGASVDNSSGTMFVNSSDIPSFIWLEKVNKKNSYYRYSSHFEVIKDQYGYPGSKPPWGNLTSVNLNTGKINWTIPFGEYAELSKDNVPITGSVNFGGVTATAGNLVLLLEQLIIKYEHIIHQMAKSYGVLK